MRNRRVHLRSGPPLVPLRGRNLNGFSVSLFRTRPEDVRPQLHLPFTCRYHKTLWRTLR
jgi:hypothetical protein